MKMQDNNTVEKKIKDLLVDYEPDFNEKDWLKMQAKLKSLPKNKNKTIIISLFKYAAAIFILGLLVYNYWGGYKPVKMIALNTINEKKEVNLIDGTNIWLNKSTTLTYPESFKNKNREVYLEGEAYFEVAKDSFKTFIVNTPSSKVSVLGTKFNIKILEENEEEIVSVTEGKVLISSNYSDQKIILTKGEKSNFNKINHNFTKKQIDDLNYSSWKTNKIQFINTSLEEVVNTISKHYNTKIILGNNQLKDIKLTATFNNEPLNEVLEIIALTLNIEIEYDVNEIRLK